MLCELSEARENWIGQFAMSIDQSEVEAATYAIAEAEEAELGHVLDNYRSLLNRFKELLEPNFLKFLNT
jgi:hypothetical protein